MTSSFDPTPSAEGTHATHFDWLGREPFTLVLSAGFFGFFAHTGFLAALVEAGLRPKRLVGVSAGALVAGLYAGGMPPDEIRQRLYQLERRDFWDPGLPLCGLLRGRALADKLRATLPVVRFECLRVPLCVVAFDVLAWQSVNLDRGDLPSAVHASCAVPLMFRPVRRQGRWLVDGGAADRSGLGAVGRHERCCLHHLPSSHARPYLRPDLALLALRDNCLARLATGLPQVTPFALREGPRAFDAAYDKTRRWLEQRLAGCTA
jgi:NTE family protein